MTEIENMTLEELEEYNKKLKKEELVREAMRLTEAKTQATQEAEDARLEKVRTEAVDAYKKAELKKLAEANQGSTQEPQQVQAKKAPTNAILEVASEKLRNEFERVKPILGLSEDRQIEGLTYPELIKKAARGGYRK